MATITRTVNGRRVTTKLKESTSEFSKRLRETRIAKRKASDIKRRGGRATVQMIGGEVVLIETKQPELFDLTGEKAKSKDGIITGFSRADLTKKRSQEAAKRKELGKISAREVARSFIRGEQIKVKAPFKRVDISVQSKVSKPSSGEVSTQRIVQTLPSSLKIATTTKADIPKAIRLDQERFLKEVKPIIRTPSKLEKVETTIAQKIGTRKLASAIERFQERRFKDFKGGVPLGSKIPEKILTDLLRRPVTNTALILGSAGFGRLIQSGGLALSKLAAKSPVLAKRLGISGKAAGGLLGAAYVGGVVNQAVQEYSTKGKLNDTTSDVIRELLLLRAGAKLGQSVKTQKLTSLRKSLNKLPKAERVKLDKQFTKLEKVAAREFKTRELGLVTKLDTQQIGRTIQKGLRGQEQLRVKKDTLLTATENKIFFTKRVPKKTGTFEVKQLFIDKGGVDTYGVATYKAKFNTATGKVELIGKPLSIKATRDLKDPLVREVLSGFKRFGGKKVVTVDKKVPVKGFDRILVKGKLETVLYAGKGKDFSIVKPISDIVSVKPSKRVVKTVLGVKEDVKVTGSFDELLKTQLVQFTINPKTKKITPVKSGKFVKAAPKLQNLVVIGEKGGISIRVGQLSKVLPEFGVKEAVSKPVVGVTPSKVGDTGLKVVPFTKGQLGKAKPSKAVTGVSKPVSKPVIKPLVVSKPKTVSVQRFEQVTKPKIGVSGKSRSRQEQKPVTKVSVAQIQDLTQALKPKVKVSQKQIVQERIRGLKAKLKAPVKIPVLPLIKFSSIKKSKKVKPKTKITQVTKFTTTILRPTTGKKGKGVKIGKFELFTGAELR